MYSRPTKIRRKLCVESVDLTLVTDEPVALLARKKKVGKIVLNKGKGNITLPNVIVHVDNKLTEMRNFRNAQTRHPGFFETVDCIQVGNRIRCMSQAQYMAVRPCYLFMAQKDNGNLYNGVSNFRIESDISPCCILSKYDI